MKRQRTGTDLDETHISPIGFDDVLSFLQDDRLTCDQLLVLENQIQHFYAKRANLFVQDFPSDLLVPILTNILVSQTTKANRKLPLYLAWRTVSKSWHDSFAKIDFSKWFKITPGMKFDVDRLMSLFRFSSADFGEFIHDSLDFKLLTSLKSLGLPLHIPSDQRPLVSTLTQLTKLNLQQNPIASDTLGRLTNLQALTLRFGHHAYELAPLTKLHTLKLYDLTNSYPIEQASYLEALPLLKHVATDDPNFFQTGSGKCKVSGVGVYVGEWKEGKFHGQGRLEYNDLDLYEGGWHEGQRHGRGKMVYWDKNLLCQESTYTGDWKEGMITGQGLKVYRTGESYDGTWDSGWRTGYGVYKFTDGAVYEGNFNESHISGDGKCVYANGDTYEGQWARGLRHGQGKYVVAKDGGTFEGAWSSGVLLGVADELEDGLFCGQLKNEDSDGETRGSDSSDSDS